VGHRFRGVWEDPDIGSSIVADTSGRREDCSFQIQPQNCEIFFFDCHGISVKVCREHCLLNFEVGTCKLMYCVAISKETVALLPIPSIICL